MRGKRITNLFVVIITLTTCLASSWILSIDAKPHEELEFEPIQFKPPVPQKHVLSNGMVLYLLEDHELPVFDINGLVKTGTIYDPADKIGLASIFASVMRTGGTISREPDALNEELESMAASVEIGMSPEYGTVSLSSLAEDIEKGLEIFSDILQNPAFREDKLELRKQQAIEAIRRRNDNPIQLAWRNFSSILFGKDHPFGWYSEIEHVESISVEDLQAFHAKYYHPNNIMLAITGDFDTDTLITQLENAFDGWATTDIVIPTITEVENIPVPSVNYIHKDLPQTTMLIGHFGIKRSPDFPDFFALRVMNEILGEGGFTSRLMAEVREKHGLAYMVGSLMSMSFYTNPGEWFAYSQTRTEKTAEAIDLIINVVKDLRDNPVPSDELQRTKDSLINSFVFSFESSSQIAFQQMMLAYRGFAPDYLETYTDNIAGVTAEDVQNVAQKYLHPDSLTIVTVGNQENFDRPLSEFGEVNVIEIKQPEPLPVEPIPEASDTDIAKARAILNTCVEAHGGLNKLAAVENFVLESNNTLNTPGGPMELQVGTTLLYPDKFRQDVNTPQGTITMIYDGEAAYATSVMGTQPLPPEITTAIKDVLFRDPIHLLVHLTQSESAQLQFAGSEEVDGIPASILVTEQPSGEMLKIYISDETNYIVKLVYRETEQGLTLNKENFYYDFREIDGLMIPHSYVQNIDGNPYIDSRSTSVKLNSDLDESMFEKPE